MDESEQHQSISEFYQTAEAFCFLLEAKAVYDGELFANQLADIVSRLYRAALHLEVVEPDSGEMLPDAVPRLEAAGIQEYIRQLFGRYDSYFSLVDPYEKNSAAASMISLDAVDTYIDIKSGLVAWQESEDFSLNDIVAHWKFNFIFGWGENVTKLLVALQRIISGRLLAE